MITFKTGNLLEDSAQALVNPVNCVGKSGAGLARQFAKRWPVFERVYRTYCRLGKVNLGYVIAHPMPGTEKRWIICFPTKRHWRDASQLQDIEDSLKFLVGTYLPEMWPVASIAIPKLGCGLGGLEWREVRPLILEAFKESPCDVRIYGEAP